MPMLVNPSKVALLVPFGLRGGRLYEPLQVEPGLRCACACPGCGAPLVAKHAPAGKVVPHFAHMNATSCGTGLESALHLAAKQLIADRKEVHLPGLAVEVDALSVDGELVVRHAELRPRGLIPLLNVRVEESLVGLRPDLIAITHFEHVLIEIAVTSFVGPEKLERIKTTGNPAVEFDLSGLRAFNFQTLENALFTSAGKSTWVWHPEVASTKDNLQREVNLELEQRRLVWEAEQERVKARDALLSQEYARRIRGTRLSRTETPTSRPPSETERAARAKRFASLSETEKLVSATGALGTAGKQMAELLPVKVRGASSIGARPLVWQTAVFAALVHPALKHGQSSFNSDFVRAWIRERFSVTENVSAFGVAVWDFLDGLAKLHILHRRVAQEFLVMVPDVVGALTIARDAREKGVRPQTWATSWPSREKALALARVFSRVYGDAYAWETVAGLLPEVREQETPLDTLVFYKRSYHGGMDAMALRRYFLAAGFTALG